MSFALIEAVKQYPILYDKQHRDAKSKDIKERIWENVATQLRLGSGSLAKAKWRNIRDSYVKYLRAMKSNNKTEMRKYIKWPWAENMKFLKPYLDIIYYDANKKSVISSDGQITEENNEEIRPTHLEYEDFIEMPIKEEMMISSDAFSAPSIEDPIYSNNNFERRTLDCLDAEDLMFLSFCQTLKKFAKRRQAEVKKQIYLIINQAEMEHIEEEEKSQVGN